MIAMPHTNITPTEKTKITFFSSPLAFKAVSIEPEKAAKTIAGIKNHQQMLICHASFQLSECTALALSVQQLVLTSVKTDIPVLMVWSGTDGASVRQDH